MKIKPYHKKWKKLRPWIGFRTLLTLALLLGSLSYIFLISPDRNENRDDQAADKKAKAITWFGTADKQRRELVSQDDADGALSDNSQSSLVTKAEKALTRADGLLSRERRLVDLEHENRQLRQRLDEWPQSHQPIAEKCQREGSPFSLTQSQSQLLLAGSLIGARFINNVNKSVDLTVNGVDHRLHIGGIARFKDNGRLCRVGLLGIVNNVTARFAVICCSQPG